MVISSVDNHYIKDIILLKNKKNRDEIKKFIVETPHLVKEAYRANLLEEVIILEGNDCFFENIKTTYVTLNVMKKLSNLETPSVIIGICKYFSNEELTNHLLVLDNLQDPGNVGTIIRSAVAFGFETIIISDNSVSIYNDKVIRSSQGMIFQVNILIKNLEKYLPELKNDYHLYGTSVTNGKSIKEISSTNKLAIVLGNEGKGISENIFKLCDDNIYIPLENTCESLNVAVAGSILMYEVNNR